MMQLNITLQDLYDYLQENPDDIEKFEVETRYGFLPIEWCDITAKNSTIIRVELENGQYIETSPKHRLFSRAWVSVDSLQVGDELLTRSGYVKVSNITLLDFTEDLFDIEVQNRHEFYANDIVSHNSSILNSLVYGLYGKSHTGIPKAKLVNSINGKELIVEVTFETNGAEYLVRRGQKPNVFEIYKNGELVKQDAAVKDYQAYLEESILKCGFTSFIQLIVLNVSAFTSFLSLSATARKEVVEQILNIRIFSVMNDLLKEKMQTNATLLGEIQNQLDILKARLQTERSLILTLRNQKKVQTEEINTKLAEAKEQLAEHQANIEKLVKAQDKLTKALDKYDSFKETRTSVRQKSASLRSELKRLQKDLSFILSNDVCPFCHQDITDTHKETIGGGLKENVATLESQLADLDAESAKLDAKEEKFQEAMSRFQKIASSLTAENTAIGYLNQTITELNAKKEAPSSTDDVSVHEEEARAMAVKAKELLEEKAELVQRRGVMEQSTALLRDKGIKTKVIEQYLPIINAQVNKYLNDMDFYISFALDETFAETIKSRERDEFSYENLSQGERRRLDLAILVTWRYIAELKNSCATNLLICDEILENFDTLGAESAMKLFQSLTGVNVFVISHRSDIQEYGFDHVYKVEKRGQFSTIEEV